jgi:hypothetical protein
MKLEHNMRTSDGNKEFSEWLIKLGDGNLESIDNEIEIPSEFIIESSLIDFIYGKTISIKDVEAMSDRAILCPKNDATLEINNEIIERLEGVSKTYLSIDTVESENDSERLAYPVEVLNSLELSGLPPHKLTLKKGCVIMLLRNLNTRAGLCNGTRLIVRELKNNVIDANILKEKSLGERVFIPRIDLIPSEDEFPVTVRRRQFPIRPAFAMTINKSQGQTFEKVGIYLPSPVFSHGQLYVAFSRAKSKNNVKIKIEETERQGKLESKSDRVFTINCVYKEIYDKILSSTYIRNFLPPIEHLKISEINKNFGTQDSNATEEYYFNESDVETQEYYGEMSFHRNLSERAYEALKFLIQNDAYDSMKKLIDLWVKKGFTKLADEIISYIRTLPERIHTNELEVEIYYYHKISSSVHAPVLENFFAVETEALGDCFYHAVSISLIGNGSLSTALRFATVAKIIEFQNLLKNKVRRRFYEAFQTNNSEEYVCLLEDLAFSAGFVSSFFKINPNEILFPQHLIDANLHYNASKRIQYGTLFHQFIASMITNRPLHCYGRLESPPRAQRILWSLEYEDRPPINFTHVDNNHFIGLLPNDEDVTPNEKYTYYGYFMSDEDNVVFLNREIRASFFNY